MKRFLIFIVLAIVIVGVISVIVFWNHDSNPSDTNSSLEENHVSNANTNNNTNTSFSNVNEEMAENRISNIIQNSNEILSSTTAETELSAFSTTIKDKAEGRLTNINLTCTVLNNTVVPNGATFSFNETVGQPTAERGYQEASVIIDHKTEKGIGGRKLPSK